MRRTLGAIIVVVLFGARKLPELASALGKFMKGIAGIPGLPVLPPSAGDGVDDRGAARKLDGARALPTALGGFRPGAGVDAGPGASGGEPGRASRPQFRPGPPLELHRLRAGSPVRGGPALAPSPALPLRGLCVPDP